MATGLIASRIIQVFISGRGSTTPSSAGTKSHAALAAPVSATSEAPAGSPADSGSASQSGQAGQAGAVTVSGAINGTFAPGGHYGCLPVQAIGGQVGGKAVLLGVGNGRVSLGIDAGPNPALWAGSGVSMTASAYVFDATLQPGPGGAGQVTIKGSMTCG